MLARAAHAAHVLVLLATGLAACGRPPVDVVLITLDATRADHLTPYGYKRGITPNVDRFADGSVVYQEAWSAASWTLPAHASLLTGKHPTSHGADFKKAGRDVNPLAENQVTLAELLTQAGYETGAFVGGPWLSPEFGLLQGYAVKDADVRTIGGRSAEEVTDRALAWLRNVPADRPIHLFVNYFDPHAPHSPPSGYDDLPLARSRDAIDVELVNRGTPAPPEAVAADLDRYDGEIRFMDHHLGRLLDGLVAAKRYDSALIVVLADHGESFGEHTLAGHGGSLYEVVLRIPLIVHYPDGRGADVAVDTVVSIVDLLPLVVDEVGLAVPADIEGRLFGERDLVLAESSRDANAIKSYGARFDRDLFAVIRWPWKLILSDRDPPELYDLFRDPPELVNEWEFKIGVGIELRNAAFKARAALRPPVPAETARNANQ